MNRRQLLGVLAASTGVTGGCAVLGGEDEPRVTVETAIVTQPSNERHPTVEFTFTDEGDDPKIETTDDIDRITLGPGQYHLVSHRVYYDAPDDHCFPDGDYTSTHVVEFHDIDATVEFDLRMAFSDGQISALDVEQRDGDD